LLKVNVESAAHWDQRNGVMVAIGGFFKRFITGEQPAPVTTEQVNWQQATNPALHDSF